ncbi:MAG: hypothetical protein AB7V14_08450 [Kiritimatiellia bacterium]
MAGIAYPAPSDSPHIIGQGVLWAQGEPGALATIWQEFPVLTAGIAYRLGWNPAEALQSSTVFFGTLLVGMTMLLTRRLFDSDAAAWIAGGWAAANPELLSYSVNSMPEIGFAACLVSAYAVLAPAIRGRGLNMAPLLAGYGLLGLGMYFKPLDSLTAVALATGWLAVISYAQIKTASVRLLAGLLLYAAVVAPHYVLQNSAAGAEGLSLVNRAGGLVYGHRAYDSKVNYSPDGFYADDIAEFQRLGTVKWLWRHRTEVGQRYFSNALKSLRIYGNDLFPGAFRIGNAWFIALLAAIMLAGLAGPRWRVYAFLSLAAMAIPLGISLSFVFGRWLAIYVPLLISMVSGFLVLSPSLWAAPWKKTVWLVLAAVLMVHSASLAKEKLEDKAWNWENQRAISGWLRQNSLPDERIMAIQPSLALEVDLDHPRRWVQLKAGTPERIEEFARERNVSYVVLCDSFYPHWPVNQLVRGGTAPENWELAHDRTFSREHPVWGFQEENYRIYKRRPPSNKESTAP